MRSIQGIVGILVGRNSVNDLWCADDLVFIAVNEKYWM